jgi:hypothetical protein
MTGNRLFYDVAEKLPAAMAPLEGFALNNLANVLAQNAKPLLRFGHLSDRCVAPAA